MNTSTKTDFNKIIFQKVIKNIKKRLKESLNRVFI